MSNLIKSASYTTSQQFRLIEIADLSSAVNRAGKTSHGKAEHPDESAHPDAEAGAMREQWLRDARDMAEQIIGQARKQAEELKARAMSEIEQWWNERRREDEQKAEEARRQGFEAGYAAGRAEAEAAVQQEYADLLEQARNVMETAVAQKQAIIREAEPFLVGLACSIAGKIIGKQLTLEPEWTIDMIRSVLGRRREKGTITLCVSPKLYSFVIDARDELRKAVDSQAELMIVADASVADHGCVIRSDFGSLDARIDTQLTEVRNALIRIAESDGGRDDDA